MKLVFEDTTLLPQVEEFIRDNALQLHIDIVGKVNHDDIEIYYQKATFFILGSHKEGGPFSLIEAMACGCIPIVTNIPAFKAMTNNGDCGFLFSPGNFIELVSILKQLNSVNLIELKNRVLRQFELYLSNKAISNLHLQIFSS